MVTQYGMSERFGMMALETSGSQYLGGEGRLSCSSETAKEIDEEVLALIQKSQDNARDILMANRDKLDQLTAHLIEKETITGAEFMEILAVEE